MTEFTPYKGREGKTGLSDHMCLIFGNGVEIELEVYGKAGPESERRVIESSRDPVQILEDLANPNIGSNLKQSRLVRRLPIKMGPNASGTDIVKVHFLPETSLAQRADDPNLVPESEKRIVAIDCLRGFISMAKALKENSIPINGHNENEDFYLYAATNEGFAAFLRGKCGFRGSIPGADAWIKKSEFLSEENMVRMKKSLEILSKSLQ